MDRVTGIGGIFFQAKDPKALRAWYRRHLGIDVQDWGGAALEGNVVDDFSDSEHRKFGWVIDPEGHKIELWEPPADARY